MAKKKDTTKKENGKPGRPASEFDERYQVRHSLEMRAAWEHAAKADGRGLQEWIRRILNGAATKAGAKFAG